MFILILLLHKHTTNFHAHANILAHAGNLHMQEVFACARNNLHMQEGFAHALNLHIHAYDDKTYSNLVMIITDIIFPDT